jgi:hypothetical protein
MAATATASAIEQTAARGLFAARFRSFATVVAAIAMSTTTEQTTALASARIGLFAARFRSRSFAAVVATTIAQTAEQTTALPTARIGLPAARFRSRSFAAVAATTIAQTAEQTTAAADRMDQLVRSKVLQPVLRSSRCRGVRNDQTREQPRALPQPQDESDSKFWQHVLSAGAAAGDSQHVLAGASQPHRPSIRFSN